MLFSENWAEKQPSISYMQMDFMEMQDEHLLCSIYSLPSKSSGNLFQESLLNQNLWMFSLLPKIT